MKITLRGSKGGEVGCDIQVHESEKGVCLLSEHIPHHWAIVLRLAASMIFLTNTEKGINNLKKVIRPGVDLRSFRGAGGCMVVEKREGSVQQIYSGQWWVHCMALNMFPSIPNYRQHIVFYLETNKQKAMTTAHDLHHPYGFCMWDWIQSGLGCLVKELCEPLSVSSIEVTQPIWLRRKKAFLSA